MSNAKNTETVVSRSPRRIYPYKGLALICFGGHRYVSQCEAEDCSFDLDHPVTKVEAPEGVEGPKSIEVSQRKRGSKTKTETWVLFD